MKLSAGWGWAKNVPHPNLKNEKKKKKKQKSDLSSQSRILFPNLLVFIFISQIFKACIMLLWTISLLSNLT